MTLPAGSISRAPPAEPGAAYQTLRADGIALVQAMAGTVWTDYNFSDPGVTILEQLAYALTELPYRAAVPVADLLADPGGGRTPPRRHGLFSAWSILPCNPTTPDDLRRLLLDRIEDAANLWLELPCDAAGRPCLTGLYDIVVQPHRGAGEWAEGARADDGRAALARAVRRCFVAHRALGEDIASLTILAPLDVEVIARIRIAHGSDPSDALAAALFALEQMLAPEPERLPLAAWQALQPTTADVFAGPLPLHGFIADDQLRPRASSFLAEDLAEALSEVADVVAIERFAVRVDGRETPLSGSDEIAVPPGRVLRLRTTPSPQGRFPIRMVRDHARCAPDPDRVRRRLAALRGQRGQRWPLRQDYARAYPMPAGSTHDPAGYVSVQTQFPRVYGIGRDGLPPAAGAMRRGQARQLKGYLMPFDQLLADHFAQLASLPRLFSIAAGGDATYAWQSLRPIVPDAGPLLAPDYERRLAEMVAETDGIARRQTAILDLLLGFQGLRLAPPVSPPASGTRAYPRAGTDEASARIAALRRLLGDAPAATRDRGRGDDYLAPHRHPRARAGCERLARIQLGLAAADHGSDGSPSIVPDPADADFGTLLDDDVGTMVATRFRPLADDDDPAAADTADDDADAPFAGRAIAADLLPVLGHSGAYRIGEVDDGVVLTCRDARGRWWLLATFADEAALRHAVRRIRRAARRSFRDLYLVDWILLRHAAAPRHGAPASYGFRITAVLPADPDEEDMVPTGDGDADDSGWRTQASAILRANVPAHLLLDVVFLDEDALARFDHLHHAWRDALRRGSARHLAQACDRLEAFLVRHLALQEETTPGGDEAPSPPETSPPPAIPPAIDPPAPPPATGPRPPGASPATDPDAAPPTGDVLDLIPSAEPATPSAPVPQPPGPVAPAVPPPPPDDPPPDTAPEPSWWRRLGDAILGALRWLVRTFGRILLLDAIQRLAARLFGRLAPGASGSVEEPLPPPTPPLPAEPPAPPPPATMPAAPPFPPAPAGGARAPAGGRLGVVPPGASGFDTASRLTATSAEAFREAGFTFAVRYLSRATPQQSGDLSAAEADTILAAGLALMAVQHVQAEGWHPTQSLGASYGAAAVANALACALPRGISVWLDLEGVAGGTAATDVIAYCNAWFGEVTRGGFRAGLYVGANCGLTADQLGALDCRYYWRSGSSSAPNVTGAAYCMTQTIRTSFVIAGTSYDQDDIPTDATGRTPVCAMPGPADTGTTGPEGGTTP